MIVYWGLSTLSPSKHIGIIFFEKHIVNPKEYVIRKMGFIYGKYLYVYTYYSD